MKKLLFCILLGAVAGFACKRELPPPVEPGHREVVTTRDIDQNRLNPEARMFYSQFRTIVKAAGLGRFQPSTRTGDIDTMELDPITQELLALDIEDEMGNKISFFDLSEQEQDLFLYDYEILCAADLSQKLAICPEGEWLIQAENDVVQRCLEIDAAQQTRAVEIAINHPREFFQNVEDGMIELYAVGGGFGSGGSGGGSGGGTTGGGTTLPETPNVTGRAATLVRKLHEFGRRGDILLNRPIGGDNYVPYFEGNTYSPVGHVSIILKQVPLDIEDSETDIVVGAWNGEGVTNNYETINEWAKEPSYIMGLQRSVWTWHWYGVDLSHKPVGNPAALADKAMSSGIFGKPYCSNYAKVITAKWYAPSEFICSSLVWWCAKKVYDINPSPWLSPTVTPNNLFYSQNTYIRATID